MSCKKMAIYYVLYYIPIDRRDVSSLDFAVVLNRTLTIYSPFLSLFNFLNNSIQFIFLLQLLDPLYHSEEDNPLNQNLQNSSAFNKVNFCHVPLFRGLSSSRRYSGSHN